MSELLDFSERVSAAPTPASEVQPAARRVLESPSLFGPGSEAETATAFEVKFLLTEDQVHEVLERIHGKMTLDAFADPALGNAYLTTSMYTDTQSFDVYYRTPGYNRDKFRVRRYGHGGPVFVERKTKNGDRVRKQRSKIDPGEVPELTAPSLNGEWAGEWFHSQLIEKQLQPVCRVAYERVAFIGTTDTGVVRVTFDRNIRGLVASQWDLQVVGQEPVIVPNRVVCEFKYRVAMPALLRGIVADLALTPTPFSKYRTFVQFAGLVPATTHPAETGRGNG